jgi:hypothetical protein
MVVELRLIITANILRKEDIGLFITTNLIK